MPTLTIINKCDNCSIIKVLKAIKRYKKDGFTECTVTEKPYKEPIFTKRRCGCSDTRIVRNPTAYHIELRRPA